MADQFSLRGAILLNASQFESTINRARQDLQSFGGRVNRLRREVSQSFNNITSAASEFGNNLKDITLQAGAAFGAIGTGFYVAAGVANEFQNLSTSLGITTERAQVLAAQFNMVGLEADDIGDVFNTLADKSVDAAEAGSAAAEDFALLGVTFDQLKNKNPDELFNTFADAVEKTKDPVKRQTALVRILGDDLGRKLGPALQNGAKGFDQLREQLKSTGVLMDQQTIQKAAAARQEMNKLGVIIKSGVTKAFVQLAPFITKAATALQDMVRDGDLFKNKIPAAMLMAGDAAAIMANGFRSAKIVGKTLAVGFHSIRGAVLGVADAFITAGQSIGMNWENPVRESFLAVATEVENAKKSLHDTLMEPLPSEQWKKWKDDFFSEPLTIDVVRGSKDKAGGSSAIAEQAKKDGQVYGMEFEKSMQSTLSGSFQDAITGDFSNIRDRWKSLLTQMAADALAAQLLQGVGIGTGAAEGTTGQNFFSGALNFLSGGVGSAILPTAGAAATASGGATIIQNITAPNPSSFIESAGAIRARTRQTLG